MGNYKHTTSTNTQPNKMVLFHIRLTGNAQRKRMQHDLKMHHQHLILRKLVVRKAATAPTGIVIDLSHILHANEIFSSERNGHLYVALGAAEYVQCDFHTKFESLNNISQEFQIKVLRDDGTTPVVFGGDGIESIDLFFEFDSNDQVHGAH